MFKKNVFIVSFIVLSVLMYGNSFGQTRGELEQRRAELTRDIDMLNSNIKKMSKDKNVTMKQLRALNAQLKLREKKIKNINTEIHVLDNQIRENEKTVSSLKDQLEQLKKEYAQTIRLAQRNKSAYNKMAFIFASKDFNQAYSRIKYLQQFGDYRKSQADEIVRTQKQINLKIVELDKTKDAKKGVLVVAETEKATVGKEKQLQESVVNSLKQEESKLKNELAVKKKEASRLNRMIQETIRKEIEEARRKAAEEERQREKEQVKAKPSNTPAPSKSSSSSSALSATPETAKLSADFLENKGRLPWPVAHGVVTQGMGKATREKNVVVQIDGVLIQTAPDAPIRSVFGGEVVRVLDLGNSVAVLIRHGEYFTVYANMKSASVSKGQKVGLKQVIGTASTDSQDGIAEFKFGLWKGSTPQDPEQWLAR